MEVPSNNANKKTVEETYQKKSELETILLRPETYIGSIEKHEQALWVYENDTMVNRSVTYVPGLYKIFDEILVNAADNKRRDPKMDALRVTIDVENNMISVYNNGDGVPVVTHKEEGVYVPELIFGHLLTSSNYDDSEKKTTGGRNGYGAKLANIFSTEFVVETADGERLKKYEQVFSNNMGKKSSPSIMKCKQGENWTKISFKPDLAKFSMEMLEEDVVALMKKRVIDIAGCLGRNVKVKLNGKCVPIKSFQDYVKLYLRTVSESKADIPRSFYLKVGERWEICVSTTEGQFQQVSFVNSIATIKGGTHVDYITNQITNYLVGFVNKKNKTANIKAHNVKNYLWVFVNALIDNPAFDSQTKETLTLHQSNFGSKCELPDDFLKKVAKSDIVENLLSWAKFKNEKELKKTYGTKRGRVNIPKLEDAYEAGTNNSHKCTLILTEGDSAKTLAISGLGAFPQAVRDLYGVFPLRGKLLNVREATLKQLNENKEIESIKKILGLQENKQYDNTESLRYGHLMIMTDQDYDGSHIMGLLINFIYYFWPSLLRIPSFLVEFITPIVKASHHNGTVLSFYTMAEYKSWKETMIGNPKGWTIKYCKGLGTNEKKEGMEYFSEIQTHQKDFFWEDEEDGNAIELAFSKKKIEARKNWLREFQPSTHLDLKSKLIKYRDFINKELILFSVAGLQRSIPSLVDGLKPAQRKILFCCFKRNLVKELKVVQLQGYVSEHSAYHHGEACLQSTIISMAQNYIGSNNVNLLAPRGQFGTRCNGGKDHASPRYIFTCLSPITRFLFSKDDDSILDYLQEDGLSIEPTWYAPIIPLVLVNGCEGIGTGWSTSIPNFNPRDIFANIRCLLNDEKMEPVHPWYRCFKGTIERVASEESGASYAVNGIIEEVNETTLRITELPVRRWTEDYKDFLNSVVENGRDEMGNLLKDSFIKGFRKYGDDISVCFEVLLSEEKMSEAKKDGLLKKFKLTTTISTSNMHLFNPKGIIKKYDSPEEILEEFFHLRLELYEKRKMLKLLSLEKELLVLGNKVRFILGVVSGEIVLNRKSADLLMELRQKGFTPFPKNIPVEAVVSGATDDTIASESGEEEDEEESVTATCNVQSDDYEYLLSMSILSLTLDSVEKLCSEKDSINEELETLRRTTPKDIWFKYLEAFEMQLDKLEAEDAAERQKSANDKTNGQAEDAAERQKSSNDKANGQGGFKVSQQGPENPWKNNKTGKDEVKASISKMETESVAEVVKPKARAGAKKVPAKKQEKPTLILVDEDDEVGSQKDQLKAYTLDSSPEQYNAMEKPLATVSELSDSEDDQVDLGDKDEDSDVEVVSAPQAKKKGGRKPAAAAANPKAAKPPTGTKKGGAVQKLLTEMPKPAENSGISPEKKERKIRESGAKKVPAKKQEKPTLILVDEDDEVGSQKDQLKAYTLDSSPEQYNAMDTDVPQKPGRKPASKRAPEKPLTTVSELSDSEDDQVDLDDKDEDSDVEVVSAPQAKKKGGRKPAAAAANPKAAKPPTGTKKRGAVQKLLTEMPKPAENAGISPEKKVRKMRESPFNKKSGSLLGRVGQGIEATTAGMEELSVSTMTSGDEDEVVEVAARAKPQRVNHTQDECVTISDSDNDEEEAAVCFYFDIW